MTVKTGICSGRHDVGQARQGNETVLQHLHSDRRYGASNKLCLNRPIQLYLGLNNMTNLHQFT